MCVLLFIAAGWMQGVFGRLAEWAVEDIWSTQSEGFPLVWYPDAHCLSEYPVRQKRRFIHLKSAGRNFLFLCFGEKKTVIILMFLSNKYLFRSVHFVNAPKKNQWWIVCLLVLVQFWLTAGQVALYCGVYWCVYWSVWCRKEFTEK